MKILQCFDKISRFFSTQTLRYDIIVNDFMIKKGSAFSRMLLTMPFATKQMSLFAYHPIMSVSVASE